MDEYDVELATLTAVDMSPAPLLSVIRGLGFCIEEISLGPAK
jgi:hypothetical protein